MLVSPMVCYYPYEDIFNFHHVSLSKLQKFRIFCVVRQCSGTWLISFPA
jgi:hypothetical protein